MTSKNKKEQIYCPRCYSPLHREISENSEDSNQEYNYVCSNNTCPTKQQKCRWNAKGYLNNDLCPNICHDHFLLGSYYAINSNIRRMTIEKKHRELPIFSCKFLRVYIKSNPICNDTATAIRRNRYKFVLLYKTKIGWIQYQNGFDMIFKSLKIFKYILKKYREKPSYLTIRYLRSYLEIDEYSKWWNDVLIWILNYKYPDLKKEIDKSFEIFEKRKDLKIPLNK